MATAPISTEYSTMTAPRVSVRSSASRFTQFVDRSVTPPFVPVTTTVVVLDGEGSNPGVFGLHTFA
jgi:hypothetical protein